MINIKGTVIVVAIGYGLYYFANTGNFTLFPPKESVIIDAIKQAQPDYGEQYEMSLQNKCTRIGGGMVKEGVYACTIDFEGKQGQQPFQEKIIMVKRNNKWVVKQ